MPRIGRRACVLRLDCYLKIIILLVAHLPARASDHSGTIIVYSVAQSEVAVAADSRVMDYGAHRVTASDDYCKIAAFDNKFIFAVGGRTGRKASFAVGNFSVHNPLDSVHSWDAKELVTSCAAANDSLREIAQCWGKKAAWHHTVDSRNGVMPQLARGLTIIEDGFFADVRESRSEAIHIRIRTENPAKFFGFATYHYVTEVIAAQGDQLHTNAMGVDDALIEFLFNQTERAHEWHVIGDKLSTKTIHEQVMSWPPFFIQLSYDALAGDAREHIGGPIDEVLIDADGIHWINRKENCPEKE